MYIDKEYYKDTFQGTEIPDEEFTALVRAASDIIDSVVLLPITDKEDERIKKATAYQVEHLFLQGGIEAINGFSASGVETAEKLGDYSITQKQSQKAMENSLSVNGTPVSSIAVACLRNGGYMNRWAYAGREKKCQAQT